ncbi:hypothetical protein KAZ57_01620 [Patescibacteria group bacterium]|nr:hypothetical protein [Patescibacteria group bacterium]
MNESNNNTVKFIFFMGAFITLVFGTLILIAPFAQPYLERIAAGFEAQNSQAAAVSSGNVSTEDMWESSHWSNTDFVPQDSSFSCPEGICIKVSYVITAGANTLPGEIWNADVNTLDLLSGVPYTLTGLQGNDPAKCAAAPDTNGNFESSGYTNFDLSQNCLPTTLGISNPNAEVVINMEVVLLAAGDLP